MNGAYNVYLHLFFVKHSANINVRVYARTLVSIYVFIYTILVENLRKSEPSDLEIDVTVLTFSSEE